MKPKNNFFDFFIIYLADEHHAEAQTAMVGSHQRAQPSHRRRRQERSVGERAAMFVRQASTDAPDFRASPIIRYFAKSDASFRYNVLSMLLFVVILNCEAASLVGGGKAGTEDHKSMIGP